MGDVTVDVQVAGTDGDPVPYNISYNIGTQGVQEFFFVNIKLRQVANSACQSIVRLPV